MPARCSPIPAIAHGPSARVSAGAALFARRRSAHRARARGRAGPRRERRPAARTAGARRVVTPAHQYPLGYEMSLERRKALLEWAAEQEAYVLEDDYDGDYRYEGRPIASLQGMDERTRDLHRQLQQDPVSGAAHRLRDRARALVGAFIDAKHVADGHTALLDTRRPRCVHPRRTPGAAPPQDAHDLRRAAPGVPRRGENAGGRRGLRAGPRRHARDGHLQGQPHAAPRRSCSRGRMCSLRHRSPSAIQVRRDGTRRPGVRLRRRVARCRESGLRIVRRAIVSIGGLDS